jgi:hypothetical protein
MSDYTITTDFGAKDDLLSGNAAKIIKGSEFTIEFTNIKTAVNSKADTAGDTFTGAVTFDADVTLNADVTFDTNTMFVDVSENRVGIGNVAPATALDVTGVITTDGLTSSAGIDVTGTVTASGLTVDTDTLHVDATNDRVGIGTTSPVTNLHVAGGNSGTNQALFRTSSGGGGGLQIVCSDLSVANPLWSINTFFGEALAFGDGTSEHMRINASGNVGIGTTNPSNPFHVYHATNNIVGMLESGDTTCGIDLKDNAATGRIANTSGKLSIQADTGAEGADSRIDFKVDNSEKMRITSAGNVGIGTDSPNYETHIHEATADEDARIQLTNADTGFGTGDGFHIIMNGNTSGKQVNLLNREASPLALWTNNAERMRITSTGNVGIGTTNLTRKFRVVDATDASVDFRTTDGTDRSFEIDVTSSASEVTIGTATNHALAVKTNDTERLRIDSSGNVLVGKTSSSIAVAGTTIEPIGRTWSSVDGAYVAGFNRLTSDGDIVQFRKDGTTAGSIGVESNGRPYFANSVSDGLKISNDSVAPCNGTGGNNDNAIDLGYSSNRWKDIYRSGSTYSTSDRNKKQDIRDLTDAEARVAVVAKGSLKAFRYIDTVEAEGDDANIHFGIIAQDLKAAFEAEGLNADSYQVLKTSTYTDDDGVEQTTYSVCYENLLAFIISAI